MAQDAGKCLVILCSSSYVSVIER